MNCRTEVDHYQGAISIILFHEQQMTFAFLCRLEEENGHLSEQLVQMAEKHEEEVSSLMALYRNTVKELDELRGNAGPCKSDFIIVQNFRVQPGNCVVSSWCVMMHCFGEVVV